MVDCFECLLIISSCTYVIPADGNSVIFAVHIFWYWYACGLWAWEAKKRSFFRLPRHTSLQRLSLEEAASMKLSVCIKLNLHGRWQVFFPPVGVYNMHYHIHIFRATWLIIGYFILQRKWSRDTGWYCGQRCKCVGRKHGKEGFRRWLWKQRTDGGKLRCRRPLLTQGRRVPENSLSKPEICDGEMFVSWATTTLDGGNTGARLLNGLFLVPLAAS